MDGLRQSPTVPFRIAILFVCEKLLIEKMFLVSVGLTQVKGKRVREMSRKGYDCDQFNGYFLARLDPKL